MKDPTSNSGPTAHPPSRDARLIVGLGASAGGIGALREFFAHVPERSGIAYVVILHLSPDHESRLAEVLQTVTPLPVTQASEEVTIAPDHVYVVPPSRTLAIRDGRLSLSAMVRPEQRRAPVDMFFRTLADAQGPQAVAVILSGTGADGSSGFKRVKEQGGLTVAQDPATAEYGDMPAAAIATRLVDLVLPVAAMPGKILDYAQRLDEEERTGAAAPAPEEAGALCEVLALLRVRTGHDFSNYKSGTVLRRIGRRMAVRQQATAGEYARLMREQPDEAAALMKDLLISATSFFRDPEAFAVLEARVVPQLFAGRHGSDQVRVWSAGCATGEEAYSLAMLLAECASTLADAPAVQIFATDLDEQAIATAREGVYTEAEVADVPPDRLQRFFERTTRGYRVRRQLRDLVLFAHHNVLRDPPFCHLDLVVCRNLLIYLNHGVQKRLIDTFHFALRPGRYLFLGPTEAPDRASDLFVPVDAGAHTYESRTVAGRLRPPPLEPMRAPLPPRGVDALIGERLLPMELHRRLLELYAPPSLVVSEDQRVVHISEHAARYLHVAPGEPSRDVFRLVRPELRTDLRAALQRAGREGSTVVVDDVRVETDRGGMAIRLTVRPVLREGQPPRGFFLVLFEQQPAAPAAATGVQLAGRAGGADATEAEEELARVRAQLHVTVEQYETQVEEAKASNEELQALNEELRSSAEELETSKEELQSVNEELTTVNQELKIKVEELATTNNDFQNFIASSEIGAVFLDRSLRVKLVTPRARDVFNLLPSDIDRRLSDITTRLVENELHADVQQVLERLQPIEREVHTAEGRWYLMRILLYRTTDGRVDGVVLTFLDISSRRQTEEQLRLGEQRLRLLIDSAADYAIFTLSSDGRVEFWNVGAQRMFGWEAGEIVGQAADVLFTPEDRAAGVPAEELRTAALAGRASDERWHIRKDGSQFYCSGVTTRLGDTAALGFAKIARDLTASRAADLALRDAHAQLETRVDERTNELQARVAQHAASEEHATMLLRKLVTAQEDERIRIARDLHDQLGQQLTALRLTLERHAQHCTPGDGGDELKRAVELAAAVDAEVDFLAWELRPAALDDLGLGAALPRFVAEWSKHYGVPAEFRLAGFAAGDLSRDGEVTFYRVAQEALNNVMKHAHATRVDVLLETRGGVVTLLVEDDGVGFDVTDRRLAGEGIGLVGMRERAAHVGAALEIESTPGHGTSVFLRCKTPA